MLVFSGESQGPIAQPDNTAGLWIIEEKVLLCTYICNWLDLQVFFNTSKDVKLLLYMLPLEDIKEPTVTTIWRD